MAENLADGKNARKRVANFSKAEKEVLLPIVNKYKKIVENKRTDAVCSKQKLQAWDKICDEFNAKGVSEYRPAENLKGLWDNLKRNARKHLSSLRQETFKTGGGSNPVREDPLANQIKGIIGIKSEPMDNSCDDDPLSVNDDDGIDNLKPSIEVMAMEVEAGNFIQLSSDVNENEVIITLKRVNKNLFSNSRPRKSSEDSNTLAQAKINYIEALKKEALEKSAMEKEILRNKLVIQDLKIELLRKQIENN